MKRRAALGRQLPGVGGELRMLLPAERGAAEVDEMLLVGGFRRDQAASRAEVDEGGAVPRREWPLWEVFLRANGW